MAVIYDPNKEQEEQQQQEGQTSQTVLSQPSQTATGTGPSQQQSQGSGSFTNLQKYISANEGRGFGQQVAGKVENTANEASKAQSDASNSFQQSVQQNTVQYNPDLVKRATQNAADFVKNQADMMEFQKLRDASYQGPKSLQDKQEDYLKAQSATNKAVQQGENTQSEAGRKALLQEFYQRPTYLRGEQNLDNLILQNVGSNRQALKQASETAKAKGADFGNLQKYLSEAAKQAADTTAKTKQNVATELGAAKGKSAGDLQQQLTNYNTLQQEQYNKLVQGLESGELTEAQAKLLGIQPNIRDVASEMVNQQRQPVEVSLMGLDPLSASYLSRPKGSLAGVASDEQRAQIAALAQLAGLSNPAQFIEGYNADVGKLDVNNPLAFDQQAFAKQREQQQRAMEAELAQTMADARLSGYEDDGDYSQYSYKGLVDSMPNLAGMTLPQAEQALAGFEERLKPLFERVEKGLLGSNYGTPTYYREGKTKEGNLRRVYDGLKSQIQNARNQINAQRNSIADRFGANKKLKIK